MSENKITKRSDLFREYARVMDMCEGTKVSPRECLKWQGEICRSIPTLNDDIHTYDFALAIIEDRPVFSGDVLWTKDGEKRTITGLSAPYLNHNMGICRIDYLTWQEQKRTITINGKEYPAPIATVKPDKEKIEFSFDVGSCAYYFKSLADRDMCLLAITDLLNGK